MSINLAIFKNALQVLAVFGLNVTKDKELIGMVQNALEFQYTPWGNTDDSTKLRQSIVDSNSDRSFLASSILACIIHSTHAPSYLYEFGYHTNSSLPPALPKWMGVTHGANFQFDFGVPFLNMTGLPQYNDADKKCQLPCNEDVHQLCQAGKPHTRATVKRSTVDSVQFVQSRLPPY